MVCTSSWCSVLALRSWSAARDTVLRNVAMLRLRGTRARSIGAGQRAGGRGRARARARARAREHRSEPQRPAPYEVSARTVWMLLFSLGG